MNYYNEIKQELIKNEITKRVKDYSKNRSDLNAYYNVGKMLSEAGKHYGEGIIKEYAKKLTYEVNRKYSYRTLFRIKQFYNLFSSEKVSALPTQLSWSHYVELLILKNFDEINYYISISLQQNLTYRQLHNKIKSNEYKRLPEETKNKLSNNGRTNLKDLVPNPIIIKNISLNEKVSEYTLKQIILNNLDDFLKQLGYGFTYVGNEYKIKLDNRYNYIDLLLFNYEYNCFVVVELKVTGLKKEHIGQIQVYMNYIDENLKKINQDKTIGIIICKQDNKYVIKYCSDDRIIARVYELT